MRLPRLLPPCADHERLRVVLAIGPVVDDRHTAGSHQPVCLPWVAPPLIVMAEQQVSDLMKVKPPLEHTPLRMRREPDDHRGYPCHRSSAVHLATSRPGGALSCATPRSNVRDDTTRATPCSPRTVKSGSDTADRQSTRMPGLGNPRRPRRESRRPARQRP